MCFDLTDEDSFNAVNFWMSDLNANASKSAVKMLQYIHAPIIKFVLKQYDFE